jgi:hypothetical protein
MELRAYYSEEFATATRRSRCDNRQTYFVSAHELLPSLAIRLITFR